MSHTSWPPCWRLLHIFAVMYCVCFTNFKIICKVNKILINKFGKNIMFQIKKCKGLLFIYLILQWEPIFSLFFFISNFYVSWFKILGDGELSLKLNIKARSFSVSAKEKLEAAGCSLTVLPGRKKWVKPSVAKNIARANEYFAKKRAQAAPTDSPPP